MRGKNVITNQNFLLNFQEYKRYIHVGQNIDEIERKILYLLDNNVGTNFNLIEKVNQNHSLKNIVQNEKIFQEMLKSKNFLKC